jgi:transposase-like protein
MIAEHSLLLQSDPVCPWCGHRHRDALEWRSDDDFHECDSCGREFHYERVVTVEYTTDVP